MAVSIRASDFIGVYAVVERVVLEPSEAAPQRIQIWGAFALSDGKSGSNYGTAQRGYLYYECPAGRETVCRTEWTDLKSVAGKDTGVGFGARYKATGRIRKADEKPAADAWSVYALLAAYAAINVPVTRVLSTPMTWALARAARGPLSDSVFHYLTAANLLAAAVPAALAIALPFVFRRRPLAMRLWAAVPAIAIVMVGPRAPRRSGGSVSS